MPATATGAESPPAEGGDSRPGDAGGGGGQLLRLARVAQGLSRRELARMARISAQQVASVESGRSGASLQAALALAGALGMSVEELFGAAAPVPMVSAWPVAPARATGARVVLAPVGDRFVALPLAGAAGIGFGPAAGVTVAGPSPGPEPDDPEGSLLVRPIEPRRPAVVVAGDDPALALLRVPLGLLDPPLGLAWWPHCGGAALGLAARGLVHAAAVGLHAGPGQDRPCRAEGLLRQGAEVIGFCSWRHGLVLRPERAAGIAGIADLARAGLRVVNREPGTRARQLLDGQLAGHGIDPGQLPGYHTQVAGHLQVAGAIAAGLADAGIASEPAALTHGLAFVPLVTEHVDLVISPAAGTLATRALRTALTSRWLADQLASLPGYDLSHYGERITVSAGTAAPGGQRLPGHGDLERGPG